MTVNIDGSGRVVIPKKYREEFNLKPDSTANLLPSPDGMGLLLFRLTPKCANCGGERELTVIENICLCEGCRKLFKYKLNK